VSSRGKG